MTTISQDSAFIEMIAAGVERCGIDVSLLREDYWRLCDIANSMAPSAQGVNRSCTQMSLSEARTLIGEARAALVRRITSKLEA